jgi:hypothetical protein
VWWNRVIMSPDINAFFVSRRHRQAPEEEVRPLSCATNNKQTFPHNLSPDIRVESKAERSARTFT